MAWALVIALVLLVVTTTQLGAGWGYFLNGLALLGAVLAAASVVVWLAWWCSRS